MKAFKHEKTGFAGAQTGRVSTAHIHRANAPKSIDLPRQRSADPDFAELEDLIDEVSEIEAARKRLLSRDLGAEEKAKTEALIAKWEAKRLWNTVAKVVVFTKHICACGHGMEPVFSHQMLKQEHRHQSFTRRTISASRKVMEESVTADGIATSMMMQVKSVPVCACCAGEKGLDLMAPMEMVEVPGDGVAI